MPFVIDGEEVEVRIAQEKKQFAEGELEQVVASSPHRVAPPCPYFGRCGGCSYQHIAYAHQLEVKRSQVAQLLRRIGHFAELTVEPTIPSPAEYGYRNRITVHVVDGVVGYFRRDAHELIDVEQCPIAEPGVNDVLRALRARKPREGHYTLRAQEGPRVFAQTNDAVAEALANLVSEMLPRGQALLVDAYAGAGFFTKRLHPHFERVVGIEWDGHAVTAALGNAAPNEQYINGDVEQELRWQLERATPASTSVIVDPPATGLGAEARRALLAHPPHTLVYVSCNPSTLARDLRELASKFTIARVVPLDMFPQTAEIEVAVQCRGAYRIDSQAVLSQPGAPSATPFAQITSTRSAHPLPSLYRTR